MIGAAYLSGREETALQVTVALQIPILHIVQWGDFRRKASPLPSGPIAQLRPGTRNAVEGIIGHSFCQPHVLERALVIRSPRPTPSRSNDDPPRSTLLLKATMLHTTKNLNSSEMLSLTFVRLSSHEDGTADECGTVVVRHIFNRDEKLSPGAMTMLKVSSWLSYLIRTFTNVSQGCYGLKLSARRDLRAIGSIQTLAL